MPKLDLPPLSHTRKRTRTRARARRARLASGGARARGCEVQAVDSSLMSHQGEMCLASLGRLSCLLTVRDAR